MNSSFSTRQRQHAKGFTLFEVMIALAVLAFAILALVKQATMSVKVTNAVEEKTIAYWIAENKLNELRIVPEWPATGKFEDDKVPMAGRDWYVEWEVYDSPYFKDLRTVEVSVADIKSKERKITKLIGIIGKN